jgi:hypothetical protein
MPSPVPTLLRWNSSPAGRLKPWTWHAYARERAEVERLSGQRAVPILLLDSGEVMSGTGLIVSWAQANEPVRTGG